MDTTGSSQNRDERLRRRRERERTRRAGETAERRERILRQRRERDRLDALHKVRRGGRVHCSKCAVPVVRDRHLRLLRRRSVVHHALQWLHANNRYYLNVRINVDALALLPEDGNLNRLHSITLDSTIDDPELLSVQNEDPPTMPTFQLLSSPAPISG